MNQVRRSPRSGQKAAADPPRVPDLPDVLLGSDAHLYVNVASLPPGARAGRRVIRCVALTPREEAELRRRIHEIGLEVLVDIAGKSGKRKERPR